MCRYALELNKVHYVCLPCRRSFKYRWGAIRPGEAVRPRLCPECRRRMVNAGHDFAPPRRGDRARWAVIAAVLGAGLRYEGFTVCGCSRDPGFRPRTKAQVRARRRLAARTGASEAALLAARDPYAITAPAQR
jgi:hypothetical protein